MFADKEAVGVGEVNNLRNQIKDLKYELDDLLR